MIPLSACHGLAGFHVQRPAPALPWLQALGDEWLTSRNDISWHAHDAWEIYLQLDGSTRWQDRRRTVTLEPGHAYLVPPGLEHRLAGVEGVRHHFIFAIIDLDGWLALRHPDLTPLAQRARPRFHTGPAEALRAPFGLLSSAVTRASARRDLALAIALDAIVLAGLEWAVEPEPANLRPEHRAVALVRSRIDAAPGRRWTLAELAAGTGLGPKHLCTRFGREVGQTPHQYLLAARIAGIKHALASTDLPITNLAADFGFASSQHLSRVFARCVGQSPRRFRARYCGARDDGRIIPLARDAS